MVFVVITIFYSTRQREMSFILHFRSYGKNCRRNNTERDYVPINVSL